LDAAKETNGLLKFKYDIVLYVLNTKKAEIKKLKKKIEIVIPTTFKAHAKKQNN
jgi:hypothetical protein